MRCALRDTKLRDMSFRNPTVRAWSRASATTVRPRPGERLGGTGRDERICVDGEPLDEVAFVRTFNEVAPYTRVVDASEDHPLSFFETMVGMAYMTFADGPVDVAVIELGMGGCWYATNIADAQVAVVLPVAVDHAK
jgi:hypothetical protein